MRIGFRCAELITHVFAWHSGSLAQSGPASSPVETREGRRSGWQPRFGRAPLEVNRAALLLDRERGISLKDLAKTYGISKASVCRVIKDARQAVSKGFVPTASTSTDTKELRPPITAA